uniref:J domain-containing protein n=1 Tax=Pseudo-nitzschia australis TaxID=44445 RepID=A0A7S4ADR9_9STRA|mmetsp:Transcript_23168/g.50636  ORF Transcript_23168/g.50636 Transcript_23168/m.50636 type:complete len:495 (+) Transcript_23168:121-1605(+)
MAGVTQVNLSFNSQTSIGSSLDLQIIDETYGKNADLYEDVLRVPTTATQDEIQVAYFDRRSELFTILAKIDAAARGPQSGSSAFLASIGKRRYLAERKMESVVFAVRILTDPSLRIAYDKVRLERTGIVVPSTTSAVAVGYTLQQTPSAATNGSSSKNKKNKKSSKSNKYSPQSEDSRTPSRVLTPKESPSLPMVSSSSSSASESKNWIQSTLSSPIFSNFSGSKAEDDVVKDPNDDEERNPRKSKRRQKQQQLSSSPNPDRDAIPIQERHPERVKEQEKKSLWGRKKRKKKTQHKDPNRTPLNDSIDTNVTDTSLTDNEETNMHMHSRNSKKTGEINTTRPNLSIKSSTSSPSTDYDGGSPPEATRRAAERRSSKNRREIIEAETIDDDDDTTRRDDDTRTFMGDDGETFATASVFSKDEDDLQGKASCGGRNGMFSCISASKTFKSLTDELSGACEDTLVSVDQVFHAFTLTDKDIKAVTKKIGKAKRLLEN